jgi:hypothetical protein
MANRFVGGILSSKQPQSGGFVSRASTGTYFNNLGQLTTAPANQPRLNYSFNGSPASNRYSNLFSSAYIGFADSSNVLDLGGRQASMECFVYLTTAAGTQIITGKHGGTSDWNASTGFEWQIQYSSSTFIFVYNSSGSAVSITPASTFPTNTWYHVAVATDASNNIGFFVNGTRVGTATNAITKPTTRTNIRIGNDLNGNYTVGYISNFRFISGANAYNPTLTTLTVPTSILTSVAGTQLLTCQSSGLIDNGSNAFSLAVSGTITYNTFIPPTFTPDLTSGTGWYNPAVLIEPASTNIITYSQGSMTTGWTAYGGQGTITNNVAIAPDGTQTAASFTENTAAGAYFIFIQGISVVAGTPYTASFYVKAVNRIRVQMAFSNYGNWVGGNGVTVGFDLVTGAFSPISSTPTAMSMTNAGNGWWRISVTGTPLVTMASNMFVQLDSATSGAFSAATNTYTGNGQVGIYVWGAQLEANRYGPTSYIPTTSVAVTRAQDDVGPLGSGVYSLSTLQTQTAIDDQATVQTFTSTGTSTWTAPQDVTSVEVLVVAGGGSGGGGSGAIGGGGGGAGGIVYNTSYPVVPGATYPIVVGAGGVGANRALGTSGGNSQFGTLVAAGGGAGSSDGTVNIGGRGLTGGSGGGGSGRSGVGAPGFAGQGYSGSNGATNAYYAGGAGGGAGGPATPFSGSVAGSGGPGLYFNISGTSTAYGGGGGGGGSNFSSVSTAGTGGVGGGGGGTSTSINGTAGTVNTGGGGGASGWNTDTGSILGGNGGSGIVIVKYKRTPTQISSTSNAAIVTQKFTVSNSWTAPAGVTQVEILTVGGGGGGWGNTTGGQTPGGGGGGGGVVYNSALTVTPGSLYNIIIGAGGAGGTTSSNTGATGSSSISGGSTELVTNGTFPNTTSGWTAAGGTLTTITRGSGYAAQFVTTGNTPIYQSISVTSGQTYTLSYLHISGYTAAYISTNTNSGGSIANPGDQTGTNTYASVTFTAAASSYYVVIYGIGSTTSYFTNVSVRQNAIVALGGGSTSGNVGTSGGSGGGARNGAGGAATQPGSGSGGFGNAGGSATGGANAAGGGGGAGSAGQAGGAVIGGTGGSGIAFGITGNIEYYAGGGGGGGYNGSGSLYYGPGGIGGGGDGSINSVNASSGAPNTGGGGGGCGSGSGGNGGTGGSGVVIIRYRVPTVATFLDSGTWTCPAGITSVQALIVAGGGGGGYATLQNGGGGGGAGGLIYSSSISVTPGVTYPVVVGQGGAGSTVTAVQGFNGSNSSFSNLIAIGGGGGGSYQASPYTSRFGIAGGSGGGGAGNILSAPGGTGTYGQGNTGGTGYDISGADGGAGGGGAGGAGFDSDNAGTTAGVGNNGGIGLQYSISGTATYYAGGGGGGSGNVSAGSGGAGGGGAGGVNAGGNGFNGTQNTGGGGGGASAGTGGTGGSGIVIIRYYGG